MKKYLPLILLLCFSLYSCETTRSIQQDFKRDEICNDSLYLSLKKKNINQMSEREYNYFLQHEKLCTEASRDSGMNGAEVVGVVVCVLLVLSVVGVIVANSKKH